MAKVIKILIAAVVIIGAVFVWTQNVGDIQGKVMGAKAQAKKKAREIQRAGETTPEEIEKAKQCRDMLVRIAQAKRAAEERKGVAVANTTWQEILPFLKMNDIPKCPSGGTYHINPAVQAPTCSIGGNGTVDPADDHIISHW
ncbi:MAG TPA: hypothetical protein PLS31_06465 [Candidatus Sumerlaeota bacterium]|nr:hypothetical protein [Candidatus Sumerlaeota bacterium]